MYNDAMGVQWLAAKGISAPDLGWESQTDKSIFDPAGTGGEGEYGSFGDTIESNGLSQEELLFLEQWKLDNTEELARLEALLDEEPTPEDDAPEPERLNLFNPSLF